MGVRARLVPCLTCGRVVVTRDAYCDVHRPVRVDERPSRALRAGRAKGKKARDRVVLRRAGFRCEECGLGGRALVVHHVVHLVDGGGEGLSNLRALCVSCHKEEHRVRGG